MVFYPALVLYLKFTCIPNSSNIFTGHDDVSAEKCWEIYHFFYLFRRHLNKGRFENCEIHDLITKHVLFFFAEKLQKKNCWCYNQPKSSFEILI